jgi:hypothetical protein
MKLYGQKNKKAKAFLLPLMGIFIEYGIHTHGYYVMRNKQDCKWCAL